MVEADGLGRPPVVDVEALGGQGLGQVSRQAKARIVSVTPTAVGRDSRTFRHAASIARLGYESIVFEGMPSQQGAALRFQLLSFEEHHLNRTGVLDRLRGFLLMGMLELTRLILGRRPAINPVAYVRAAWMTWHQLPAADLYYLHAPHQFLAVALKSWRLGSRFIYDAHDAYHLPELFSSRRDRILTRVFARIERRCVRSAAVFSTATPRLARILEQRYGRTPTAVLNMSDPRLDEPVDRDLRQVAGIAPESFLVVIVGNHKPFSAFSGVLEALAALPNDVHLAVVGAGWDEKWNEVEERDLAERVHVLPPVRPPQVTRFIDCADVSLIEYRTLPEIDHAIPNRFFHSIAAGLPLLYSSLTGVREVAERYRVGLEIDLVNPDSVAATITRLRREPGLLDGLRANVDRARSELSWDREEPKISAMIESALAARRDRHSARGAQSQV
jgi:glycosyltransferase involved in cell wall biosynthesis